MNISTRKPLIIVSAALAAALAMPAMAQSTHADHSAHDAATQQDANAAAPAAASGGAQTWQSVDADGDGAISKQEAQVNAGLSQIFDQADGDGDGKLTTDEYKAYVAKQQSGGNGASPSEQP